MLIFDEVQAGFGRTGKFWAFEHYGVTPDVICCGKGISSSLPLSAVIGRAEIMDQFAPGSMTSTHTGNPVCCAAALASVKKIVGENLTGNAARLEPVLLRRLEARSSERIRMSSATSARAAWSAACKPEARHEGTRPRSRARHHRTLFPQRPAVLRPGRRLGADREDCARR